MEVAGAFVAWLGIFVVVLADGRYGLALGTLLAAAGIAAVSLPIAGPTASAALAVGGLIASAGRLVAGPPGWTVMPAGSTPRLVLGVAGGLLALWVGLAVTSGSGAGLRFAVVSMLSLAAARALSSDSGPVVLTAFGLLALAVGAAAGLSGPPHDGWPYLAAATVAAAAAWVPLRTPRAA